MCKDPPPLQNTHTSSPHPNLYKPVPYAAPSKSVPGATRYLQAWQGEKRWLLARHQELLELVQIVLQQLHLNTISAQDIERLRVRG